MKVLVADDAPLIRSRMARLVGALPGVASVVQTHDVTSTLAAIRCERPDAVLLDLFLGEGTGLDVLHAIAHDSQRPRTIVMTAWAELDTRRRCVEAGADHYFEKGSGFLDALRTLETMVVQRARATLQAQAAGAHSALSSANPAPAAGAAPVADAELPRLTQRDAADAIGSGQITPHFQPVADLHSGRIVGAEALARWHHPERGVLDAQTFMPLLTERSVIDTLTLRMVAQASAACRRWHDGGLPLDVSVNLSLRTLAEAGLATRIDATVRDAGLRACHLTFEISETAAMTRVAPALDNLRRLRVWGYGVAIDDFGTAMSSIEQLGRVDYTALKIDRSFVLAMHELPHARAIVDASIDMARRLGIPAVAVGVRTAADRELLDSAGCQLLQGDLVSPALADDDFVALCLRERRR